MRIDIERERFAFALVFAAANEDHEGLRALHDDLLALPGERIADLAVSVALLLGTVLRAPHIDRDGTLAGWASELAAAAARAGEPS